MDSTIYTVKAKPTPISQEAVSKRLRGIAVMVNQAFSQRITQERLSEAELLISELQRIRNNQELNEANSDTLQGLINALQQTINQEA